MTKEKFMNAAKAGQQSKMRHGPSKINSTSSHQRKEATMTSMKHNWTYRVHAHKPYRRRRKEVPGIIWILAAAIVMVIVGLAKGAVIYDKFDLPPRAIGLDNNFDFDAYFSRGDHHGFRPDQTVRLTSITTRILVGSQWELENKDLYLFGSVEDGLPQITGPTLPPLARKKFPFDLGLGEHDVTFDFTEDNIILIAGENYWLFSLLLRFGESTRVEEPGNIRYEGYDPLPPRWVIINNHTPYGPHLRPYVRIEGDPIGDFDNDGDVDFSDFSVFVNNFTGTLTGPPTPSAIPEPASLLLFATGAILIARSRRSVK